MKRRDFIRQTGFAVLSHSALMSITPIGLSRAHAANKKKYFINVFLRGGADGLSLLAPKSNEQFQIYKNSRPDLHLPKSQLLELKGVSEFGLHPEAKRLQALFSHGHAIFAHGAGSLNSTRSHFTQQDIIEGGNKVRIPNSGYLYRALNKEAKNLEMVSIGSSLSASMNGANSKAIAMLSPESFTNIQGPRKEVRPVLSKKERIVVMATDKNGDCSDFGDSARGLLCRQALQVGRSISSVSTALPELIPGDEVKYGRSSIGNNLMQAVRLVTSETLNTQFVNVDMGGWDTHLNEGVLNGTFALKVRQLDQALGAAKDDLVRSGRWEDTVIVVMSEFGRTLAQNGTGGTDHGRGGMMMILGGALKNPGRIIAPNFDLSTLDIRDVRVEVDYRNVIAELLLDHMKVPTANVEKAFPGLELRKGFHSLFG